MSIRGKRYVEKIDGVEYWRCTNCGLSRSSFEFYRSSATSNGLTSRCKYCMNATSRHNYDMREAVRPTRLQFEDIERSRDEALQQVRETTVHVRRLWQEYLDTWDYFEPQREVVIPEYLEPYLIGFIPRKF
jgi:hypothetical protein